MTSAEKTGLVQPLLASQAVDPLQKKMVKGFRWSFAGTFIQGALQICVTITMARLLAPQDYGLYAMVEVILRWANLFGQTGLLTVLVQRQTLTDEDMRGARALALALAGGSALIVALGAPLIAAGFGNAEIVPLLRVASISFLFNGLGLTSLAALRRRMEFGRLSSAEVGGYILGNGFTAIVLALNGAGVWSVVVGSLVGQTVQNGIAIAQARLDFGLSWRGTTIKPLARQGAHVSLNSCLDVLSNTMDTFVIARVMPQALLGLFNRASMLASLPTNFLWSAVSRVTFPTYSRLQHDPVKFAGFFQRTQSWSGTLSVAVPLSMIPAADVIVAFLLGPVWVEATPILRLLLLAFAFESLAFPYHSALDALGSYYARTKIRLVILVVRASCLAMLVSSHKDLLFVTGAVAGLATWVLSVTPLARKLGIKSAIFFRHDVGTLAKAAVCAIAVALARMGLIAVHAPNYLLLIGCVVAGALSLALVLGKELKSLLRPA